MWIDKAKRVRFFSIFSFSFPGLGRGEVIGKEGPPPVGKLGRHGVRAIGQVCLVRLIRGV